MKDFEIMNYHVDFDFSLILVCIYEKISIVYLEF